MSFQQEGMSCELCIDWEEEMREGKSVCGREELFTTMMRRKAPLSTKTACQRTSGSTGYQSFKGPSRTTQSKEAHTQRSFSFFFLAESQQELQPKPVATPYFRPLSPICWGVMKGAVDHDRECYWLSSWSICKATINWPDCGFRNGLDLFCGG